MSGSEVQDASLLASDEMPPGMVFAVVCGVGVVIVWGLGAVLLGWIVASAAAWGGEWLLACVFAAAVSVVGVIGCCRRWRWVRWAALLQAVVVTAVSIPSWLDAPLSAGLIALFVAYAGLQFLPSSHRWYHPTPHNFGDSPRHPG